MCTFMYMSPRSLARDGDVRRRAIKLLTDSEVMQLDQLLSMINMKPHYPESHVSTASTPVPSAPTSTSPLTKSALAALEASSSSCDGPSAFSPLSSTSSKTTTPFQYFGMLKLSSSNTTTTTFPDLTPTKHTMFFLPPKKTQIPDPVLLELLKGSKSTDPVPTTPAGRKKILNENRARPSQDVAEDGPGSLLLSKRPRLTQKAPKGSSKKAPQGDNIAETKALGLIKLTVATKQSYIQQMIDNKKKLVVAVSVSQSTNHAEVARKLFKMAQTRDSSKDQLLGLRSTLLKK